MTAFVRGQKGGGGLLAVDTFWSFDGFAQPGSPLANQNANSLLATCHSATPTNDGPRPRLLLHHSIRSDYQLLELSSPAPTEPAPTPAAKGRVSGSLRRSVLAGRLRVAIDQKKVMTQRSLTQILQRGGNCIPRFLHDKKPRPERLPCSHATMPLSEFYQCNVLRSSETVTFGVRNWGSWRFAGAQPALSDVVLRLMQEQALLATGDGTNRSCRSPVSRPIEPRHLSPRRYRARS
jgi:hypothetical protein